MTSKELKTYRITYNSGVNVNAEDVQGHSVTTDGTAVTIYEDDCVKAYYPNALSVVRN